MTSPTALLSAPRRQVQRLFLWALLLVLLGACSSKEEPAKKVAPAPAPETVAPPEVVPEAAPEPIKLTAVGGEFTTEGVNGWQQTAFKTSASFRLWQDSASFTQARLAVEKNEKPTPALLKAEQLYSYFALTAPAAEGDHKLSVSQEVFVSPFDETTHFVRVSVHAPSAAPTRAPIKVAVVVASDPANPLTPELLREAITLTSGALAVEGDQVTIIAGAAPAVVAQGAPKTAEGRATLYAATLKAPEEMDPAKLAEVVGAALGAEGDRRVIVLSGVNPKTPGALQEALGKLSTDGLQVSTISLSTVENPAIKAAPGYTLAPDLETARGAMAKALSVPVAAKDAGIKIKWEKKSVGKYRVIGYENHTVRDPKVTGVQFFGGTSSSVLYEIKLREGEDPVGNIEVQYQLPDGINKTLQVSIDRPAADAAPSQDAQLLSALAGYSEILRGSGWADKWKLETVATLATSAAGEDLERQAFATLVTNTLPLFPTAAPVEVVAETTKKGPRKPKPTAKLDPADIGPIKSTFKKYRKDVEGCVKRIKMKHGNASGKLVLEIVVQKTGKVTSVKVKKDEVGAGLGKCVRDKARRWKFPKLHKAVTLNKPWSF